MKNKNMILRLSQYKNVLFRLKELGIVRISSENLGNAIGVKPTQVRKDFSSFKITGNKRGGYEIDSVLQKIQEILGKNDIRNVVVVGAGKIGMALTEYKGFERIGIKIQAAFDKDPEKIKTKGRIPIYPIKDLENFIKENNIKIGVIAVPDVAAQELAEKMVDNGIMGILNFSQIKLNIDEKIVVNNVHLEAELENVIYYVNNL